ncbi:MAG: glycosyltransferase family 9 protein [Bacteroidetes bacterium]|nr:MAG: glycosyltransferase family 9 protein [Bacteroidota bacterium]
MKLLILRFSSIGDIVLTTPVIRSIKKAHPDWEIHYFTKPAFRQVLESNPYIDRLHLLEKDLGKQLQSLRKEGFTYIIDLHHNLRTLRIKRSLRLPSATFDKQNIAKFLLVRFKKTFRPIPHIVTRYTDTLRKLNIGSDGEGLDFFLPEGYEAKAKEILANQSFNNPLAVVLGAQHRTKRWLPAHFITSLNQIGQPVVLIGGPDARNEADEIAAGLQVPCMDAVARYDLLTSAALMKQCRAVITHDTGFMHIAAAFHMKTYVLWGSTVPALGMTPYQTEHYSLENQSLSCRPCSKLGHDACPLGHFRCMTELLPEQLTQALTQP